MLATSPWVGDDDTCFEYMYADLLSQTAAPTASQIRQAWVDNIPATSVYIANKQARWLMDAPPTGLSLSPPQTGSFRYNMHATAIDSQITTESIGAMTPGMRQAAADLSAALANVSNDGFAVHAAQFYAAMYADAAFESNVPTIINDALAVVPTTSRTHEVIDAVRAFYQANPHSDPDDWRACQTMLHDTYGEGSTDGRYRGWIESTVNVGLTTMALLYGEGDFKRTVEIGVQGGYDADCNPATAAGLLGMIKGYEDVGGASGGILAELGVSLSDTYDVRCMKSIGELTTASAVAQKLADAAELQIVALGGAVEMRAGGKVYVLPGDVVATPPELPTPAGPAGLVGRVEAAGGAVNVSASVAYNNPGYDRQNISSIIDGVTDVTYNGYRPYWTSDATVTQPAGGDWYQLTFERDMTFNKVVFYEGDIAYNGPNNNPREVEPKGGYFEDLTVEVFRDGQWRAVDGLAFSEALDPNAYFQVIDMTFDPAVGSAVRIRGQAGGTQEFTTIVELEAYGAMGVAGDCNEDGIVDLADFAALTAGLGQAGQWANGDFNFDGVVDAADYVAFKLSWQASPGSESLVPEPASLLLLLGGGTAVIAARRRRTPRRS